MKASREIQADGTSFHGTTIIASKKRLKEVLGEDYISTDKTTHDWACMTDDGTVFTVYDWKCPNHPDNRLIVWNIGGHSKADTEKAKRELEGLI